LITLPNLRIIDHVVGDTGSKHDSSAFKHSLTAQKHNKLFQNGECILADSPYPRETWSTAPYKKALTERPNTRTFNYFVSRLRIRSQHAVGSLKGRFGSLRVLRQQIRDDRFHELSLEWIKACIVVHMMCFSIERYLPDGGMVEELLREGREDEDARAAQNWEDFWEKIDIEEAERLHIEEASKRANSRR
jgi:hypothetical protein